MAVVPEWFSDLCLMAIWKLSRILDGLAHIYKYLHAVRKEHCIPAPVSMFCGPQMPLLRQDVHKITVRTMGFTRA